MVVPRTRAESPAQTLPPARPAAARTRTPARRAPARPATPKASRTQQPNVEALAKELLAAVKRHDPAADVEGIRRAIDFGVEAHGDQKRASGEAYVTHPIAAAQILADLGIDPVAIQAAILHDVPEDTGYD